MQEYARVCTVFYILKMQDGYYSLLILIQVGAVVCTTVSNKMLRH